MQSSKRSDRFIGLRVVAAGCTLALVAGCTVSNQEAPSLAGPSGFGLVVSMTATPEVLPRDGVSKSIINVDVRSQEKPFANGRLILTADAGTLSASEVTTDGNGHVTFTFTAPGLNENVLQATIFVTPVQNGDLANARSDSIRVAVLGPEIPVAAFETVPDATKAPGPKILAVITFDASKTKLAGVACGSKCTYAWSFGDGSTGNDLVIQHQYGNSGVYNVKLTATANTGTSNSVTTPIIIAPPDLTTPDFTFAPCLSLVLKCMTFTDSSVPDNGVSIVSYYWDFGDGTSPVTTQVPTIDHTFPNIASTVNYNVKLRLTDNLGRVSTTTKSVAVP